jgi:hypothetical protein
MSRVATSYPTVFPLLDAAEDSQDAAVSNLADGEQVQIIPGAYEGDTTIKHLIFIIPLLVVLALVSIGWTTISCSSGSCFRRIEISG